MNEYPDPGELVLPFVACSDNGGPFDPSAYVAGFEVGRVYETLAQAPRWPGVLFSINVHAANVEQLDLVAMHFGYTMQQAAVEEDDDPWALVHFTRQGQHPEIELDP